MLRRTSGRFRKVIHLSLHLFLIVIRDVLIWKEYGSYLSCHRPPSPSPSFPRHSLLLPCPTFSSRPYSVSVRSFASSFLVSLFFPVLQTPSSHHSLSSIPPLQVLILPTFPCKSLSLACPFYVQPFLFLPFSPPRPLCLSRSTSPSPFCPSFALPLLTLSSPHVPSLTLVLFLGPSATLFPFASLPS